MKVVAQSHNVVDIVHGVIPYNGLEMTIMDDPLFARLHRVYQSSLVYMTYPSNKVHRFEHSMGVMHLAGIYFYNAIRNSEKASIDRLFDEVISALQELKKKNQLLVDYGQNTYADMSGGKFRSTFLAAPEEDYSCESWYNNTLYRDNTPANISRSRLYYVLFESIRLVGLLHDIGHLPYSHISEHAIQELRNEAESIATTSKLEAFQSIMASFKSQNTQIHEIIGRNLIRTIFLGLNDKFTKTEFEEDVFLTTVFNTTWQILTAETGIFCDLHKLVDGVLDCDRMDYTCRDLYCAGVSKEFPRFERIFNTVRIYFSKPPAIEYKEDKASIEKRAKSGEDREVCYFSYNSKAIGQIEMLLQRRWEDFANLNYHHSVHKHELLLKKVMVILGEQYLEAGEYEPLEGNRLPFSISALWEAMRIASGDGNVDILFSQLDDEWLNTLIRSYYFDHYGDTHKDQYINHNDPKWNMFDELITGRKHYRPLFKRRNGFSRFDEKFKEVLLSTRGMKQYKTIKEKPFFPAVLNDMVKNFSPVMTEKKYYEQVKKRIEQWVDSETVKTLKVIDCLLDENDFSLGIKARECEHAILLLSSVDTEKETYLKDQSLILSNLENQRKFFPPFHIFYLPEYDAKNSDYVDMDKNVAALSHELAKLMVEVLVAMKEEAAKYKRKNKESKGKPKTSRTKSKTGNKTKAAAKPQKAKTTTRASNKAKSTAKTRTVNAVAPKAISRTKPTAKTKLSKVTNKTQTKNRSTSKSKTTRTATKTPSKSKATARAKN